MNYWIDTQSGNHFFYDDIEKSEISIEDIAHSLSLNCRFNGHSSSFYSVAEHSLIMAIAIFDKTNSKELALQTLIHDATEAYIPDIPRPLKAYWNDNQFQVSEYEDTIAVHIYKSLDILYPTDKTWKVIKDYDYAALKKESEILFTNKHLWKFPENLPNIKLDLLLLSPTQAEIMFLQYYKILKV